MKYRIVLEVETRPFTEDELRAEGGFDDEEIEEILEEKLGAARLGDSDPDRSQAYSQGHFGSKEEADAYAADIEKLSHLEGLQLPRVTVERDRQGGWNVWVWE